jgi:hypothetical protein
MSVFVSLFFPLSFFRVSQAELCDLSIGLCHQIRKCHSQPTFFGVRERKWRRKVSSCATSEDLLERKGPLDFFDVGDGVKVSVTKCI